MNIQISLYLSISLFLITPSFSDAQSVDALMDISVEVVTANKTELLNVTINSPEKSIANGIDTSTFSGSSDKLIEKEAILLYRLTNRANKKLLVRVDPIQKLKNSSGEEMIFIIHSVGYSYDTEKDSIKYFDGIGCNELTINAEGKAYIWVDGHFFFPESMEGNFTDTTQFSSLQCEEI